MIKIIDINFLNKKAAIGCFLIKDNDDIVLIETGPSIYYDNIKNSLNKINIDINRIKRTSNKLSEIISFKTNNG